MALVRQCDLALEFGVSATAIAKALKAGRIQHAPGSDKLFDLEATRAAWAANRKRDQRVSGTGTNPTSGEGQPAAPAPTNTRTPTDDLVHWRVEREKVDVASAQLRLDQQRGELVRWIEVQPLIFDYFRTLRTRVLTLPDRLAPILAAESDIAAVRKLLLAEISAALDDFANGVAPKANGKPHRAAA